MNQIYYATNTPNLMSVSSQRMEKFFKNLFLNEDIRYYRKDIFLISYAILSKTYILLIISLLFIYNQDTIVNFFPSIFEIIFDINKLKIIDLREYLLALIFYLVSINYMIRVIKNKADKT